MAGGPADSDIRTDLMLSSRRRPAVIPGLTRDDRLNPPPVDFIGMCCICTPALARKDAMSSWVALPLPAVAPQAHEARAVGKTVDRVHRELLFAHS